MTPPVEAYGDVDELNAFLGMARAVEPSLVSMRFLFEQRDLQQSEPARHARPREDATALTRRTSTTGASATSSGIDDCEKELEPLKALVIPADSGKGAALHVARTVCSAPSGGSSPPARVEIPKSWWST